MAPDFPSDLIQDIKIRLRQAAGLASYDPSDPSLPSLPSVSDAVAALDPTLPGHLRCRRCRGGLLRGINSTLCIFCGAEQRGDGISRKISFNSTAGYRKLLQSLDLDGSEVVNLEAESKESSKVQDSKKSGLTLANVLDLELRWPREVEEIDNNSSNKASSQVAFVSLPVVDLDNFFSAQKNEVSSRSNTSHSTSNAPQVSAHGANSFSVDMDTFLSDTRNETVSSAQNGTLEQFMQIEQGVNTHINLSSTSQKLGFFEGRHPLDVAESSADAKGGDFDDDFADWETDFQSASSVTFEAKFKQIDPIQSSEDFQSANPTSVTVEPRTNHGTVGMESKQVDPFQNCSSFEPDSSAALAMESGTDDLFQNSVDFEFANSDAVENHAGFQSAISEAVAAESRHINHFQNSSTDFSPIIISKSDQNTNIGHNLGKDDPGEDLTQEVDELALGNNWFQADMWSQISTKTSKKTDQLENTSDDLWQHRTNEINNTNSPSPHDDLLDDWQDFTAATNASANSSVLQSLTSDEVHVLPSEANSRDAEDLEFGCFMQSDSFSVALNDLQSSNHENARQAGDSIADRANQSYEKTGNASAIYTGSDVSENVPDASDLDASRYKVDMLLAQMPDLSFMLEESLYIPKKPSR